MKVTLNQLCKARGFSEFQLLTLKRELISHKKTGKIFFKENMLDLDLTTPFELYYCLMPNENCAVNAFPIPLKKYRYIRDKNERYFYLKEYFECYYSNVMFEDELFVDYEGSKPYIGQDYIWYYKRTAVFS